MVHVSSDWVLTVNKQTVDRETEHKKKKMKVAGARKPESFVWAVNDVELLLRLTLNYKACKLQERAAFSDFSTLRPVFKKVHFQGYVFRICVE